MREKEKRRPFNENFSQNILRFLSDFSPFLFMRFQLINDLIKLFFLIRFHSGSQFALLCVFFLGFHSVASHFCFLSQFSLFSSTFYLEVFPDHTDLLPSPRAILISSFENNENFRGGGSPTPNSLPRAISSLSFVFYFSTSPYPSRDCAHLMGRLSHGYLCWLPFFHLD